MNSEDITLPEFLNWHFRKGHVDARRASFIAEQAKDPRSECAYLLRIAEDRLTEAQVIAFRMAAIAEQSHDEINSPSVITEELYDDGFIAPWDEHPWPAVQPASDPLAVTKPARVPMPVDDPDDIMPMSVPVIPRRKALPTRRSKAAPPDRVAVRAPFRLPTWTRPVIGYAVAVAVVCFILYGLSNLPSPRRPDRPRTQPDVVAKKDTSPRRPPPQERKLIVKEEASPGKKLDKVKSPEETLAEMEEEARKLSDPEERGSEHYKLFRYDDLLAKFQQFNREHPQLASAYLTGYFADPKNKAALFVKRPVSPMVRPGGFGDGQLAFANNPTNSLVRPLAPEDVDAALDSLVAKVESIPKPYDKDAKGVREVRGEIQAFRRANPLVQNDKLIGLRKFVAASALPQDRNPDGLLDLSTEVALAMKNRDPAATGPLRGAKYDRIYRLLVKFPADLISADPTLSRFRALVYPTDDRMGLIVPAYFDANNAGSWAAEWQKLFIARARGVDVIAIVTLPDITAGANITYRVAMVAAVAKGIRVIAYVDLARGNKDPIAVASEITERLTQYPMLQGFFLDNHPVGMEHVTIVRNIISHIRGLSAQTDKPLLVVSCPGSTPTTDGYVSDPQTSPDIICNLHSAMHPKDYTPPSWSAMNRPRHFAAILFGLAPDANLLTLRSFVWSAAEKHMGWIFVTSRANEVPGSYTLPSFFNEEVNEILLFNNQSEPDDAPGPRPNDPNATQKSKTRE